MFVHLISVFAKAFSVVLIMSALRVIINNYLAVLRFRKKSPKLPIAPKRNWLNNHWGDYTYRSETLKIFEENHKNLGKTYAFFLNERPSVSTIDLDFMKRVVLDASTCNRGKVETPLKEFDSDQINWAHDEQWKRLRKAYASALSMRNIKSANVQAELSEVENRFLNSLDWRLIEASGSGELEVNLDDLCTRWALDLTLTTLFKKPHLIDYKAPKDLIVDMFERTLNSLMNPIVIFGGNFRQFHKIADWFAMRFHFSGACRRALRRFVVEQALLNAKARKKANEANAGVKGFHFEQVDRLKISGGSEFKRNMADTVIDHLYAGSITKREYIHSSMFLFGAAGKTSADALLIILYHLANHPEKQEKLRASVEQEGIQSNYLDWFFNESLRLVSPVNVGPSRELSEDTYTSDGLLVPKGTMINCPAHLIHRLTKFWGSDAHLFKPERWANAKSFHPCQYVAFGIGKRNCPGNKLAAESIKSLVVSLLRRYKFSQTQSKAELKIKYSPLLIFLVMEKPTFVKMSPLQSTECTRL